MNTDFESAASYIDSLTDRQRQSLNVMNSLGLTGVSDDLVTPLCDRRRQTESRINLMDELAARIYPTGFKWLDEAEESQAQKIGPYSIMLPFSERADALIESVGLPEKILVDRNLLAIARENVSNRFQFPLLHLLPLKAAFESIPRNTNLGLPWLVRDVSYLPEVHARAKSILDSNYVLRYDDPAYLFWRGQPRGLSEIPKQRDVWGMSKTSIVLDEMVQIPLLDVLTQFPTFCAWVGSEAVDSAITSLLRKRDKRKLSIDFHHYDASLNEIIIEESFNLIRGWFDRSAWKHIDYIENTFLDTLLLTPFGLVRRRHGSVPSGSGLTNMIDTLAQLIILEYVSMVIDNVVEDHIAQGDDGAIIFRYPFEMDSVILEAEKLGVSISNDKGGLSFDRVYYLQNIHSVDILKNNLNVGIRPLMRILNGMMSYERFPNKDWSPYMDTLRWYQQMESGREHPKFPQLVEMLYRRDRISKSLGPREILARAGGIEVAKSLLKEGSFSYGKQSLSGLMNFSVIRELQKLKTKNQGAK